MALSNLRSGRAKLHGGFDDEVVDGLGVAGVSR